MATPRGRRRTVTLAALAVVTILILALTTGLSSGLRRAANAAVTPFNWAVNVVAQPIGHAFAGVINYSNVVSQNERLRYQLGQAELKLRETWPYSRLVQQLTTELNVPFVGGLPVVVAPVTADSPTNFAQTISIGDGSDDGLLTGMPVVGYGGLIGRVISTTAHTAVVRLLTDPASLEGVSLHGNHTAIIVSGRGDDGLTATAVPIDTPVTPGSTLFTDGLNGGLYPAGIPVATIKQVELTPGAQTYTLDLTPVANLSNLAYVDVVLWEPAS